MKHPWRYNETPEARAARKAAEQRRQDDNRNRDARTYSREGINRFRRVG